VCSLGACAASCATGLAHCGNRCVDLTDDKNNCGFCQQTCGGNLVCQNGACACPAGTQDCSGLCVDVTTNAQNCGGCGTSCLAGHTCVAGVCQ
jgi:hypothetical protein